ncbi:MAG TPA: hypothetical protein VEH77_12240, partial [Roseiarcus sp.]|nr:hypothetical protein [Roseiarcus sp.]
GRRTESTLSRGGSAFGPAAFGPAAGVSGGCGLSRCAVLAAGTLRMRFARGVSFAIAGDLQ